MIQLVRSGALANMRGGAMTEDDVISLPTLSHLGGVRSQCSDGLLAVSQWAELAAPSMRVLEHTVVSRREGERLYIRSAFDWCGPFVTGSLLLVAPVRRQASASSCGAHHRFRQGCCFGLQTVVSELFLWLSLSQRWRLGVVGKMRTARAGRSRSCYALSESV